MCVVSMVSDHYMQKFGGNQWQGTFQNPLNNNWPFNNNIVGREEFDQLKKEVLEMKELLKRAKLYDERTNQPDCEMDEKVALLKKIAEVVGVSLDDIFQKDKKIREREGV